MQDSRLPAGSGLGFKPEHYFDLADRRPSLSFIEIHAENYMGQGGPAHAMLDRLRQCYALSVHGVGLSIGGENPIDLAHLERVKTVCDRFAPCSFSEHLAWSTHDGVFFNDLLPLPYTETTLARICAHIDQIQTALNRQILLENPATYLTFRDSTIPETDFLRMIADCTGCGLLLDVNNVHVSAFNHGFSALDYLAAFPFKHVREIHLAGHAEDRTGGAELLIDTHDRLVADAVWRLFDFVLAQTGPVATLIEWDQDIPEFPVLYAEAERAAARLSHATPLKAAS